MRKLLSAVLVLVVVTTIASGAARKTNGIRSIDFKNFSVPWDDDLAAPPSDRVSPWHWINPLPESLIRVVNGMHHFYEPNQSQFERERAPLISVDSVVYGDLDGDGTEEAAVHLNYSTGGTENWDYLYVYRLVRGHSKLMGILESGSRGYGGLGRTAIQDGLLVLDFADPDRRVGDCCSEGYIRIRYHWRNRAFVEEGPRERGDLPLNTR